MDFLKKYKGYLIFAVLMTAALAAAFFFGTQKNESAATQSSVAPESSSLISVESENSGETSIQSSELSGEVTQSSVISEQTDGISAEPSEKAEESSRQTVSRTESVSQLSFVSKNSEVSGEHKPEITENSEVSEEHKPESSAPAVSEQESSKQTSSKPESIVSGVTQSSAESYEPSSPAEKSEPNLAQAQTLICTLYISCETAVNNSSLDPKKLAVLPADGIILSETEVSFAEGESVFDVLERTCRERGIVLSAPKTPFYGGAYIKGINDLCERDCGAVSGWMYSVNDKFPSVGCSGYTLKEGDSVKILYTCDLGADIGNVYMGGN